MTETPTLFDEPGPWEATDLGYSPTATVYSPHTLRGYRVDEHELARWCSPRGLPHLPAAPSTVVAHLEHLAQGGARVTTMARRLSGIAMLHHQARVPDPTRHPEVVDAWARLRQATPGDKDSSVPLLPPELFEVVRACPTVKAWADPRRPAATSLGGARDRALLLVGFVGALRRSELVALQVEDLRPVDAADGATDIVLTVRGGPRREAAEEVALRHSRHASRCPVRALQHWLDLAEITSGPVFRGVTKGNTPAHRPLHPESVNSLVQQAVERAGIAPDHYTAHSLRAGFVTYSQLLGVDDRAIAAQTRHLVLESVRAYQRDGLDEERATALRAAGQDALWPVRAG